MKRPNIVILNPDEMRWDTMGHMGNPAASTPNLDAFAATEAVSFSNAYCQNSVCVPSRCSFTTGLYPHVHGHRTMQYLLHENESTLFKELKEAGYYVWMNGRNDLIAGQVDGLIESHASEIYVYNKDENPKGGKEFPKHMGEKAFPYSHFVGLRTDEGDGDLDDTRAAVERILQPVEDDRPLCLFLGWTNPHPPYGVEEPWYSAIDRDKLTKRIKPEELKGKSLMLEKIRGYVGMEGYTEAQWDELRAVYLGQCAKVDAMFRMVCDALKARGIYDDTAIFFLSDHGDFTGDYGLPEKAQNTFEDCLVKVPLLIKPPKGEAVDPGISHSLVELVDFYATAMDYAGVVPDHDHFGRSLRQAVGDRKVSVRPYVFAEGGRMDYEYQCDEWHAAGENGPKKNNDYWPKITAQKDGLAHEKGTMIFDGRYKYIHRPSGKDEFYDLKADSGERVNIFAEHKDSEIVARLRMAMLDWYQQTCDVVPRAYDRRFSNEKLWSIVRNICPPEYEAQVEAMIKSGAELMQIIGYCLSLPSRENTEV